MVQARLAALALGRCGEVSVEGVDSFCVSR